MARIKVIRLIPEGPGQALDAVGTALKINFALFALGFN